MPTSERSVTVNKIGGANMSKLDEVLNLVKVLQEQNEAPVLVVSAFKGVTNALLAVMDKNLDGTDYNEDSIRAAFEPVLAIVNGKIDEFINDDQYKEQAHAHIAREMDICVRVLMTHKAITASLAPDDRTYKTRDKIIAFGERSVIGILEAFLQENRINAKAVNDVQYRGNNDNPSKRELHRGIQEGIAESLSPHINEIDKQILIIGGHVKDTARGMVTEIGRSYTDTTAVDVTVALGKLGVSVDSTVAWKDVDGVLSGDPKQLDPKVNTPIVHPYVSLNEGMELGGAGSTLMQIDALDLAREERIPLSLRNIEKPRAQGTTFTVGESKTNFPFKIVSANGNVDIVSCKIPQMATQPGFIAALTNIFARNGVSLNDVLTSGTTANFTINIPNDRNKAEQIELRRRINRVITQLMKVTVNGEIYECTPSWDQSKANIVIIGDELRDNKGVLEVITGVLPAEGINICGIVHTTEQIEISFYVDQKDADRAVQALHRVFIDKDHAFVKKITAGMQANIARFLT